MTVGTTPGWSRLVADVTGGRSRAHHRTDKTFPRCTVTRAGPARFGSPCPAWLRARLRTDGDRPRARLESVYPNAPGLGGQTYRDEVLGTGDGNPGQSVAMRYPPVLPGETIEVLELCGSAGGFDVAASGRDHRAGGSDGDLRVETDSRSGCGDGVWVTWTELRTCSSRRPADRHYTIERSTGTVSFGDDLHGRTRRRSDRQHRGPRLHRRWAGDRQPPGRHDHAVPVGHPGRPGDERAGRRGRRGLGVR